MELQVIIDLYSVFTYHWKLITGIIGDEIYRHLEKRSSLQNEQK